MLLVGAAQWLAPVAAPLFDGLTVLGPYHYLAPTAGQNGSPTSAKVSEALVNGASPGFNAATTETPPQAQLIAAPGAFALSAGSTAVVVTITPIVPPGPSTAGAILGNVYRFAVTNQAGTALATQPGIDVTLVLRAPDATDDAQFAQYQDGAWSKIASSPSGTPAFFIATTGGSGVFALVASTGSGSGLIEAAIAAVIVLLILALAWFVLRRRRGLRPTGSAARGPARGSAGSSARGSA
ncbi:MAG: hypothetical protein ACRDGQ_13945, partial [Candidatus Limnocylindrales bacterium]